MTTNYGIKITQKGSDVKTAQLKDFIIHSDYPHLKVFKKGEEEISLAGFSFPKTVQKKIAHNLGYIPLAECYRLSLNSLNSWVLPDYFIPTWSLDYFTDNKNLVIQLYSEVEDNNIYKVKYYIFADKGGE